jgi:uncharacterized protein YdeI (YjbR/CyaY-like superfamily)
VITGDSFWRIEVESEAALHAWLTQNGSLNDSRWLVTFKKGDHHYLPYDRIVRILIAHGWVDSQPRALDASRSMRLISPRKVGSNWSKANRERAEDLIEKAKMTPRGRRAVEAAKKDGSWTALVDIEAGLVPDDLARMLRSRVGAQTNFDAFPPSSKRLILEWIDAAKTAETRQKRLQDTADKAARNERANHYRR